MGVLISLAEGADFIGRKEPKKVETRTGKQILLSAFTLQNKGASLSLLW